MKNDIELRWKKLKNSYQPSDFSFTTTQELLGREGIIGQQSAEEALELGLKINSKGYNIYVIGESGIGKLNYVKKILKRQIWNKSVLRDICYIYNFKTPSKPQVVLLQAGDGKKFQDDMEEFIQFLENELAVKLDSYEAEKKKQKLITQLETKKEDILDELNITASEMGFVTKMTKEGIGFMPTGSDQKPLTEEQYEALSIKEKDTIKERIEALYSISDTLVEDIRKTENVYVQYLEDIDHQIVLKEVSYFIKYLREKYCMYPELLNYLDEVCKDILEHISVFAKEEESSGESLQDLFPWIMKKGITDLTQKYKVNMIVDHSETTDIPIITSRDPNYGRLIGKIQSSIEINATKVDFDCITGGLLHEANGGYLVLYAEDIIENVGSWEAIKKVLKTGEITIENMQASILGNTFTIEPEPVKANVKIILLGDERVYNLLASYDKDFKKFFKVSVYLESEIASSKENIYELASYIRSVCELESLPDVSIDGILEIVEYGKRLVSSQEKMTTNVENLIDAIRESAVFTTGIITGEAVKRAIAARERMKEQIEREMDEKYKKELLMIDVSGKKVGQINGLAVYEVNDYMFGRPVRITATTYKGQSGITDIEKEAGLGGKIHTKGIQIITGFLGSQFAQTMPLSLSCRICFEQSYSGVDGDSASSAELYAILSSLAEVPIRQNIGVTGSVNQYGQIQPVGGVNEKIEGFFRVCKQKGIQGNEGVIIPYQNRNDLMLNEEIIEYVKKGKFHIYIISDMREGIELLTGYTFTTIKEKCMEKLSRFNKSSENNKKLLKGINKH